jgi:uncharacterized protein (TIGR00369 family)
MQLTRARLRHDIRRSAMEGSSGAARRLTVEWQDPRAALEQGRGLAGLDYLGAIRDGRIPAPPVAVLIGFHLAEVEDGRAVFAFAPGEQHYNPLGSVHGGIVATLLDSAMGCAVHSTLPRGRFYTTLEIKVSYVRAVTHAAGTLRAEGRIIHGGRQAATAEARLVDSAGKLYAHGTTTCLVFDLPLDRS